MDRTNSLEEKLVPLLKAKQLVMTTAESCTGGLIAATIINVSGASAVIKEGYITYCDEAKHRLLGVKEETLQTYKAVSAQVAKEMALGGAKRAGSDICVSVTGVAGPDKEDDKPVGLVYIGVSFQGSVTAYEFHFSGNRQQIRMQAVAAAIAKVYETISGKK